MGETNIQVQSDYGIITSRGTVGDDIKAPHNVAGISLVGGVLAAYIKAQKTGIGERVTASLVHTSIWAQGLMIQSEQFPEYGESFPISYKQLNNPMNNAYKTADGRYFQTCCPAFTIISTWLPSTSPPGPTSMTS